MSRLPSALTSPSRARAPKPAAAPSGGAIERAASPSPFRPAEPDLQLASRVARARRADYEVVAAVLVQVARRERRAVARDIVAQGLLPVGVEALA